MAKCSRCGVVEILHYVDGVPVCVDCDNKTIRPQSSDSPGDREANPPKSPKKVQSISDSRPAEPKVRIMGAEPRYSEDRQRGGFSRANATSSFSSVHALVKAIKHAFDN